MMKYFIVYDKEEYRENHFLYMLNGLNQYLDNLKFIDNSFQIVIENNKQKNGIIIQNGNTENENINKKTIKNNNSINKINDKEENKIDNNNIGVCINLSHLVEIMATFLNSHPNFN